MRASGHRCGSELRQRATPALIATLMNVEVFTYFVRVAIALALIATPDFRLLDGAATGERYVLLHAWRGLPPVALRNDAG